MGEEFDPRVSLSLERHLVEDDYVVLASLNPNEVQEGLEKLRKMIREQGALGYLDKLCKAGCDRRALLWLLHPFSSEPIFGNARWSDKTDRGSIKALFGITSRELENLLKKLEDVANQLAIVNRKHEFGDLLMKIKQLYQVWRLPQTLHTCATLLRYAAKHLARNTHFYDNVAKARLTSYVLSKIESSYVVPRKSKCREFHDEEIAALISSVSGEKDCRYDATAHRMWRQKHYRRLSMLDPQVDQRLFAGSNSARLGTLQPLLQTRG